MRFYKRSEPTVGSRTLRKEGVLRCHRGRHDSLRKKSDRKRRRERTRRGSQCRWLLVKIRRLLPSMTLVWEVYRNRMFICG